MLNERFDTNDILLRRLIGGNTSAFSIIFLQYYKSLVSFAYNIVGNADAAKDIVQDTMTDLWDYRETLKIRTSLKAYLFKVVRNKCVDYFRHESVKQEYCSAALRDVLYSDTYLEQHILKSEIENLIKQALEKLPHDISVTFQMNRYDGLKYSEIADKLSISVRTVESRIGKALDLLRVELREFL